MWILTIFNTIVSIIIIGYLIKQLAARVDFRTERTFHGGKIYGFYIILWANKKNIAPNHGKRIFNVIIVPEKYLEDKPYIKYKTSLLHSMIEGYGNYLHKGT